MIQINQQLTASDLQPQLEIFWKASGKAIDAIEASCPPGSASPVFTVEGKYTAKGWTEWTQGFQYGAAILQFDATGDEHFLELGRRRTVDVMAPHLTHVGVHDHGFNNVSTYGNLWRLMNEGRIPEDPWQRAFYELALKVTGAVQAARWSTTSAGGGYIYSFNGPQSLFVDTIRSCRALALSHQLGHALMGERDAKISLLAATRPTRRRRPPATTSGTARPATFTTSAAAPPTRAVFNTNNGDYRCPSTQQGYSAFSTWTRGLAWAMLGYPEELEWLATRSDEELALVGGRAQVEALFLEAARATCDFYLKHTPACGVPYWDTGAPGLAHLGEGYLDRPADPFNEYEPVDSSAAAIAAQGLLRLGNYLCARKATPTAGTLSASSPHDRPDAAERAVSLDRPAARRPAAALGLSPPQRLGFHSPRPEHTLWRIQHVGRLPRPRIGTPARARSRAASLLHLFWHTCQRAPGMTKAAKTNTTRKVALVTGGTRGIGLGIARQLAQDGFDLAVNGRREEATVADALEALEALGATALYCRGDVAEADSRAAMVSQIRDRYGRLDVLVNNAGVAPEVRADLLDASEASFDRLIRINLRGPFFLTQEVARWMVEQRQADPSFAGVIVNITSISATVASVNRGDYCISKAGVAMATQLWAARLAEYGIQVYEVRPGVIRTDMTSAVADVYTKRIAEGLTLDPRWGTPEDVGRAVGVLARGDLAYATGNVLLVDGGLTLPRL